MHTKRILVIDDDEFSGEVAAGYLTGAGYEVVVARDGFTGLKLILTQKPDLVLTDIWMPIGTGFSLAQRLRELGVDDIPIIFMTAGREHDLRAGAAAVGVAAFFEKPYDSTDLLATVAALLARERPIDPFQRHESLRPAPNATPPDQRRCPTANDCRTTRPQTTGLRGQQPTAKV